MKFLSIPVVGILLFLLTTTHLRAQTNKSAYEQLHKKEYLSYPYIESYNFNSYSNVSVPTFYFLYRQNGIPGIKYDSVKTSAPDTAKFGIFTDKGGNKYYWVHTSLVPDSASPTFAKGEEAFKKLLDDFSGAFIVKYPYEQDTIRPGTSKMAPIKHMEDSLQSAGYHLKFEPDGSYLKNTSISNDGVTHLNMLLKSTSTGKEVLLLGESIRYGQLCVLARMFKTLPNPRIALFTFLKNVGREKDLDYTRRLLTMMIPDAINTLPQFKPYSPTPGEGTGADKDVLVTFHNTDVH